MLLTLSGIVIDKLSMLFIIFFDKTTNVSENEIILCLEASHNKISHS